MNFFELVFREISKSRICFLERFFAQMENLTEVGAQKPSLFKKDVVSIEKTGIEEFLYLQGVVNTIWELFADGKSKVGGIVLQQRKIRQNRKTGQIF